MSNAPDRSTGPRSADSTAQRTVLRDALIVDGSAAEPRVADVLIEGGHIIDVGALPRVDDARSVDLRGLVLAPGFIDLHTHSDVAMLVDGSGDSQLLQGVTLEVVGNCGQSCAPRLPGAPSAMGLGPNAAADMAWQDFEGYLRAVRDSRPGLNVAALVGHGALREAVMPGALRPADAAEISAMSGLLEECLSQGAIGLSSGLEYVPGLCADTQELVELCRCAARHGALYTTHVRNRDVHYEQGLKEALQTAREAQARVQVSHMTPKFGAPVGAAEHMLTLLDQARRDGVDAACDIIPHAWGPTMVASVLPAWVFDTGTSTDNPAVARLGPVLADRLRDPTVRQRIKAAPNPIWQLVLQSRWDDIVLFGCSVRPQWQGLTLGALGKALACDPWDVVLDLLAQAGDDFRTLTWVGRNFQPSDTALLLQHAHTGVISDAITLGQSGPLAELRWSPSTHGWAAALLQRCLRGSRPYALSLPEAVRRLTALPAQRLGLSDRGRIAAGCWADLVAFDPTRVADESTLEQPHAAPSGIHHVWVNGRCAVQAGRRTPERAGTVVGLSAHAS